MRAQRKKKLFFSLLFSVGFVPFFCWKFQWLRFYYHQNCVYMITSEGKLMYSCLEWCFSPLFISIHFLCYRIWFENSNYRGNAADCTMATYPSRNTPQWPHYYTAIEPKSSTKMSSTIKGNKDNGWLKTAFYA